MEVIALFFACIGGLIVLLVALQILRIILTALYGVTATMYGIHFARNAERLRRGGVRVAASVEQITVETNLKGTVGFQVIVAGIDPASKETRRFASHYDFYSARPKLGDTVVVFLDPTNPSNFFVDTSNIRSASRNSTPPFLLPSVPFSQTLPETSLPSSASHSELRATPEVTPTDLPTEARDTASGGSTHSDDWLHVEHDDRSESKNSASRLGLPVIVACVIAALLLILGVGLTIGHNGPTNDQLKLAPSDLGVIVVGDSLTIEELQDYWTSWYPTQAEQPGQAENIKVSIKPVDSTEYDVCVTFGWTLAGTNPPFTEAGISAFLAWEQPAPGGGAEWVNAGTLDFQNTCL